MAIFLIIGCTMDGGGEAPVQTPTLEPAPTPPEAPTPTPGPRIVTIGLFGDLETAYTAVFNSAGFKAAFPNVTILKQSEDFGGHHDRLIAQCASGTGANDIEAVEIGYIGYFVANGGLVDLAQPPYNGIDTGKDLAPYCMANATTTDGKLMALPVDIAPAVLFYRKSIADAYGAQFTKLAGGAESCLDSWDDFITEAKKVTVDTNTDGTIDQYALANAFDLAMIPLNGGKGNWFDGSGNPYEPEQRFKDVLQLVKKIRDAEIDANYDVWSGDWIDSLKNGKVVTLYSGAWMEGHFKNWICPDQAGDWRVAYIPGYTYASNGGTYLSIPEQTPSDKRALAWEIIKYLCTNPDAQLTSLRVTGAFPALTTVYADPIMSEPIPYFGGQRAREIFRFIAVKIPPQKVSKWDRTAADIFDKAIKSVIAGEKTVDQAYTDAKTEMLAHMNP